MGNVTPFKPEMQPARPYPPEVQTTDSIIYAQAQTIKELQQAIKGLAKPSDPREQDVLTRTGELDVRPAPQHASTDLSTGDICTACGQTRSAHYDSSGCIMLGCEFALKGTGTVVSWPLGALYGDPLHTVTEAIKGALLTDCGPAVGCFVSTLGHDELTMLARTLSRTAVSAHLEELAR